MPGARRFATALLNTVSVLPSTASTVRYSVDSPRAASSTITPDSTSTSWSNTNTSAAS